MSWNMSKAGTLLEDPMKELFRQGVCSCWELMDLDLDKEFAEPQFLAMTREKKFAALCYVWKGLTEDTFPGEITSWAEATIFTVFQAIRFNIEAGPGHVCSNLENLLDKAWREDNEQYEDDDFDDEDLEDKIEQLADTILWDRDWQIVYGHPNEAELAIVLGLPDNYTKDGFPVKGLAEEFEAYLKTWNEEATTLSDN